MHRIRVVAFAVALAALIGACGDGSRSKSAETLKGLVRDPLLNVRHAHLPEVTVGDERAVFPMRARPRGVLIVYFGYTHCPDICPTSLAALRRAYVTLGADARRIQTAMATVDPERDTPDVLTTYLQNFFDSNYHALRASDAEELRKAETPFLASSSVTVGTATQDHDHVVSSTEPVVTHTGTTYAVNEQGRVVVEWPFGTDATSIAHDLRILLASDSGTGT